MSKSKRSDAQQWAKEKRRTIFKIESKAAEGDLSAIASATETHIAVMDAEAARNREAGAKGGRASRRGKGIEAAIIAGRNILKADTGKAPTSGQVIHWLKQWTPDNPFEAGVFDVYVDGEQLCQNDGRSIKLRSVPRAIHDMEKENEL